MIQDKLMLDVYDVGKSLRIDFGGVIPDDDSVITATSENVADQRLALNRAFDILAENILTGEKKLFDCTYKYRGLFGKIKKLLKRSC